MVHIKITFFIVCFNLGEPVLEQTRQISFWLDFFTSSLSIPLLKAGSIPKWIIILVGLRSDEQTEFSLTQNPQRMITSWQKKYPRLPISSTLFSVSSLKSPQSVESLIKFVDNECCHIFDEHAVQIPSTYHQFILKLKDLSKQHPLEHWSEIHKKLGDETKQDSSSFKLMLQYFHSIGKIVLLPTGFVFTDPTLAPQIAAKFISPKEVRLRLLKQETDKVEILDGTDVGCLLEIDTSDNNRYD